ncbi:popeye domain-containing protein 1-like [Dermacentor variabilis]|uniref:popeye domain-containing protein 1-like n=1 Tax=Dermacentor variabilis TaxID=34621 RepID=UPI003F5B6781
MSAGDAMSAGNATATDTLQAYSVGSYFSTSVCPTWLPTNHILFQLANIFLFLSYMAPAGLYGLLYLRVCLTIGSFFFALWGYVILCAFDTMVWNAFFTAINLVHVCVLMYVLRPVRLAPHMEVVYQELFQPLKVSRQQFQAAACCIKTVKDVDPQQTYAVERVTRADCLTLVLSGRFLVSHKGRPLQIVDRLEFLDSPEWFGVGSSGGDNFQVTMTAMERCRVVVWNRDKLKLTISGDTFLQAVFDNVVGKDVVRKLLFVTESTQNNQHAENASETTKLLIQMKENAVRAASRGEKDDALVSVWSWGRRPCYRSDPETAV